LTVQRQTRLRKRLSQGFACALFALVALVAGTQGTQDAVANGDTRTLSIRQMHTGERLTVTFRRNGRYDRDALRQLNWIMRDWRRDEAREMDPRLYDTLWEVHRASRSSQPLHVVSAYRSPRTNEMLRQRSRGVARSSQHIEGKATDFYLPDVSAARLREIGMRLQRGGVGFYPRANTPFVHIDVGSVRHWPRMTRSQLSSLFPDGKTVHLPSDNRPLARYDEARREILAAGGVVAGEAGRQVAGLRSGGTRSLWSALFGDDEGEANADEAYAALPTNVSEIDQRYALFHQPSAPAAPPAPAAEPEPAPRAVAAAPTPAPEPAPAPTPPVAVAAAVPAPLPPSRPSDAPAPSEGERTAIAALAEAAAATATQASFSPASAEATVVAALPAPRPAEFGGAGTVAQLPQREEGPRLVWAAGPEGRPADASTSAEAAPVQVALAPVPPPRFDRATAAVAAAPARPETPAVAAAFAPVPPAAPPVRTASAEAPFAAVASALGLRSGGAPAPATTATAERRQRPDVPALPQTERDALRTLFSARSLAPSAPPATAVRVASASVRDGAPIGLVAIPAAGVALGFSRDGAAAPPNGFRAGPAVRRVATAD
jgi:uncharacterized protein YcbK (DUF882 family)